MGSKRFPTIQQAATKQQSDLLNKSCILARVCSFRNVFDDLGLEACSGGGEIPATPWLRQARQAAAQAGTTPAQG
jgi:hypothetical protein